MKQKQIMMVFKIIKKRGLYPASHYIIPDDKKEIALQNILSEMEERVEFFEKNGKLIEAQRIRQRTEYDVEMLREIGI